MDFNRLDEHFAAAYTGSMCESATRPEWIGDTFILTFFSKAPDARAALSAVAAEGCKQLLQRMAVNDGALSIAGLGQSLYETLEVFNNPTPWLDLTHAARDWWMSVGALTALLVRTHDRGHLMAEFGLLTSGEDAYPSPCLVGVEKEASDAY